MAWRPYSKRRSSMMSSSSGPVGTDVVEDAAEAADEVGDLDVRAAHRRRWGRCRRGPERAPGRASRPRLPRGGRAPRRGSDGPRGPSPATPPGGSDPSASATARMRARSGRSVACSALNRRASSASSPREPARRRGVAQRAQRVEDDGDVDDLLEHRAPRRGQVAERGDDHRGERQADADDDALRARCGASGGRSRALRRAGRGDRR